MPDLKLDKREWSKEKIQSRMLETAGNEWGYSPMNPAAFDPLVSLLIGACSYELEKVAHDIHNTQSRALNRLAQIMTPDVFTTPIPSHALLHARSVEPSSKANEETQVFYNLQPKEEDKTDNPIEVFFTPTSEFTIFDADVQYLIHQGAFYETKSPLNKSHIEKSTKSDPQNARILWLGIAANDEIEDLKNFSFFFDWKNDPDKKHYYELLPMAKWFIEDKRIDCKIGLPIQELGGDSQTLAGSSFEAEFNISQKRAQDVNAIYEGQFVSIKNFEGESNWQSYKKLYPLEFEAIFSEETLKEIKEELLWLKIVFPSNFPIKAIGDTYCSMNCIPVINRRLIKYNYRLHRDINIVPLRSQELFFDVRSVYDREGKEYKNNPLTNLIDYKEETFSIRYGGVARFDQRTASEMLEYVLDLLKDESDAYKALDRDDLASDIQGIKQGLRRLENSTENITHINPTPYLIVKPGEDGDTVFVEFWTTNGEKGNRIRPESSLDVYSNLDVDQESLILVTASSGGRDKLKSADSLVAYKKAIMTRGRVATIEDVKTVCKYRLGKELKKVVVKKGVMLDPRPKFGLVTTIDVLLFPIKNTDYDEEEWTNKCMELKVELERQATITYPFRVDFEWTEDHFKIKQPV